MYKVVIDSKAEQDLVDIFLYITETLKAPNAAKRLYSKIKKEISGLASMPHRCVLIAEEPYAQLGVRKLFIENYIAFSLWTKPHRRFMYSAFSITAENGTTSYSALTGCLKDSPLILYSRSLPYQQSYMVTQYMKCIML